MAGIACARTLVQAGHEVSLFEQDAEVGGRMASTASPFGSFDTGAQYFTVRDPRFEQALATTPGAARRWSANAVRVLDAHGQLSAPSLPHPNRTGSACPRWANCCAWAAPLAAAGRLHTGTRVASLQRDSLEPTRWQLRTEGEAGSRQVHAGFDAVLLALPAPAAAALLADCPAPRPWARPCPWSASHRAGP
jgi:predicted NAD/FAD-dependent oxidoreductase